MLELQELLASEENKLAHKPELDRERDLVTHLSAVKADCESIMASFTIFFFLPVAPHLSQMTCPSILS
jgi:hypothetical protein